MKGIIANTQDINLRSAKISSELFFFCNFNADSLPFITAEGEFYAKILLLYNIVKDTSIFLPKLRYILCMDSKSEQEWKRIKNIIRYSDYTTLYNTITILRGALAHNTNSVNGPKEQEEIDAFNSWKKTYCGKEVPSELVDFKKLVNQLNVYDCELYSWILQTLKYIETSKDKLIIVDHWKNEIIQWYAKKRDIFYGQLESIYRIKYQEKNGRFPRRKGNAYYVLEEWIKNTYVETYSLQMAQIHNYKLKCNGKGIPAEKRNEMLKKLQEKESSEKSKYEELLAKITKENHIQKAQLSTEHFVHYFFAVDLPEAVVRIQQEKKCSLLPQDVLQELIAERFINISFE